MKYKALAALGALALISACNKAEDKAADAPADAAATADATATPATASADSTGVPECDDYLAKIQTCINDKMPEAGRAAAKQGIDQTKAAWKNIPDKTQLGAACKMASDQAKASYSAMGCTF